MASAAVEAVPQSKLSRQYKKKRKGMTASVAAVASASGKEGEEQAVPLTQEEKDALVMKQKLPKFSQRAYLTRHFTKIRVEESKRRKAEESAGSRVTGRVSVILHKPAPRQKKKYKQSREREATAAAMAAAAAAAATASSSSSSSSSSRSKPLPEARYAIIANVVARCEYSWVPSPSEMVWKFGGRFDELSFPAVSITLVEPAVTISISANRHVCISGGSNFDDPLLAANLMAARIEESYGRPVRILNFGAVNVATHGSFGHSVNPFELYKFLEHQNAKSGDCVQFEPESFPGLIWRIMPNTTKVTTTLFTTGSSITVGIRTKQEFLAYRDILRTMLLAGIADCKLDEETFNEECQHEDEEEEAKRKEVEQARKAAEEQKKAEAKRKDEEWLEARRKEAEEKKKLEAADLLAKEVEAMLGDF